jgi:hypothetical protein
LYAVSEFLESRDIYEQVEITSDFPQALMKIKNINSRIKTGWIANPEGDWMKDDLWTILTLETLELIEASVIHIPPSRLNKQVVSKLQEEKYLTHAADCNTEESIENAVSLKVDQFSTDNVTLAIEMKAKYNKKNNL